MNRINTSTRGIGSWQERLAAPETQWVREYSAFETAVSWEFAARTQPGGLPEPIQQLLTSRFGASTLLLATAEHKVPLPGGNACSQNDVWALVQTGSGTLSLTIEAKALEPFGNSSLEGWLTAGDGEQAQLNRAARWEYLAAHLPPVGTEAYRPVAYQLLHRCASAVIEARRFGLRRAAFVVQAFNTPANQFNAFALFCQSIELDAARGAMEVTAVNEIELAIGWVDCPFATDQQIAAVA